MDNRTTLRLWPERGIRRYRLLDAANTDLTLELGKRSRVLQWVEVILNDGYLDERYAVGQPKCRVPQSAWISSR